MLNATDIAFPVGAAATYGPMEYVAPNLADTNTDTDTSESNTTEENLQKCKNNRCSVTDYEDYKLF